MATGNPRRIDRRSLLAPGEAPGEAAAEAPASAPAPTQSRRPRHVILCDWDGFDTRYLEWFDLPNIRKLIARGSYAVARGNFKAISHPSRASMVTGSYPETHGNFAYCFDSSTGKVHRKSRYLAAQTITEALAEASKITASVGWYMVQNHGNTFGDPLHPYLDEGTWASRVDAVIDILNGRPIDSGGEMITLPRIPDFIGVYTNQPDSLGHAEGPNSSKMEALMVEQDAHLGRLIQAVRDVDLYGETTFILTSDHGMKAWHKDASVPAVQAIRDLGLTPELLGPDQSASAGTNVVLVAFFHTLNVHLLGNAATPQNRRAIANALRALPQVARVFETDDIAALHGHPVEELVVETTAPYGFTSDGLDLPEGAERGSHSGLDQAWLPLIISGKGVVPNQRMLNPRIIDIAPTISALTGTPPPADATGRALSEILC